MAKGQGVGGQRMRLRMPGKVRSNLKNCGHQRPWTVSTGLALSMILVRFVWRWISYTGRCTVLGMDMAMLKLRTGILGAAALCSLLAASHAAAAGPPVFVHTEEGVDALTHKRIRDIIAQRRAVREELPLPSNTNTNTKTAKTTLSPEQAAMEERTAAIRLALERALRLESEASWDDCVREAAGALGDAVVVLSKVGNLALLRDLHLQIGSCLTLSNRASDAAPHFVAAALLDESPIKLGLRREEAENAQAAARTEVMSRLRGQVKIESEPPGAEVWIDGQKAEGRTPLSAEVRLGDHYLTLRRFRYEPHTERTVLQPGGTLRVVLDSARRETLREQLAESFRPSAREDVLSRAVWSRAEQVVLLSKGERGAVRVSLLDAAAGTEVRAGNVRPGDEDAALRRSVCGVLGETCEVKSGGIPWYVWPIAGVAVIGGVLSAALIADANREYRFCPSAGCR